MHDFGWLDRLDLFKWALLAAVSAGLVLPLIGTQLLLRRTSFQAIALPQFASVGMIAGYAVLPWWIETFGLGGLTVDEALRYLVSAGVVVPPGDATQAVLPGATAASPSRPNP